MAWLARESLRGFGRAGGSALASTWSTALACSLLFLFLCVFQAGSDWAAKERARQGWVELFLVDSVNPKSVLDVVGARFPGGQAVVVDKETAKKRFVERFGSEMLEALDSNPLPVSVRLRLDGSSEEVAIIARSLESLHGVEAVDSPQGELERLERLRGWAWRLGLACALVLFGVVFGVIRNAIQLSLKSRDRLIDNMRILGASRWQIEAPFAIEGMIQGVCGGILASALPAFGFWLLRGAVPLPVSFEPFWALRSALATIGFSSLAGALGGWWTVRRVLR
ncbi:MAG TPA: permease-like cell division protein FtsX [Fibrobacteria bacterium]|nr:permease-like cell division protein FtsX [Fibrobacteria bacterium]HOX50268.1 permease-like cell division protein FtsX [Fibrobacteria bacterium]